MRFITFYIILALGAALVLFMPTLGLIMAMTIIGIPLALIYFSIPAVFLLTSLTWLFSRLMQANKGLSIPLSIAASFLLLFAIAMPINRNIERQARSYAEEDHNDLVLPLKPDTIAVRSSLRFDKGTTKCDGFCLHALLTGAARRILVVELDRHDDITNPRPNETGIAFHLEQRNTCPKVKFVPGHHRLELKRKRTSTLQAPNAVETLKLRMSNGECLVSEPLAIENAAYIISKGRLITSTSPVKTGFSLSAPVITADRITVHRPDGDNFKEIYRWTGVRYKPLAYILIPGPITGYGLKVGMGWLRVERRLGITSKHYERPDWPNFLTNTLGLKLALNDSKTNQDILQKLELVLNANKAPTHEEWLLIEAFYNRIGLGRKGDLDNKTYHLSLQMIENPLFPPPPRLYHLVRRAAETMGEADLIRFGSILIARLESGETWSAELNVDKYDWISSLSRGISSLPDAALLPYFDRLGKLAYNPDIRIIGWRSLEKLSLFGDRAVPIQFDLIKTGLAGGRYFFRKNQFQHPYLAGLIGLCHAGKNASSALSPLLAMALNRELPIHASYGKLLVTTLFRLGADPEELWPLYSSIDQKNRTRQNFEFLLKQANSDRPHCSF